MTTRASIRSVVLGLFVTLLTGSLSAQNFLATGGSGAAGGQGGEVELRSSRGIRAGNRARVVSPRDPRMTRRATLEATDVDLNLSVEVADLDASPGDLDPDPFEVTTQRDFLVPVGTTLLVEGDVTITSTRGGIYVAGDIQDNDGANGGVSISLRSLRRGVFVLGNIDADGEDAATGGDGGSIDLNGLRVGVGGTSTISAAGGDTTAAGDGGLGGDVTVESFNPLIQARGAIIAFGANTTVDVSGGVGDTGGDGGSFTVDYRNATRSRVTLTGTIDASGGAALTGGSEGGAAGDIDVDVHDMAMLSGTFDVRGGAGDAGTDGGDGGRIRIGSNAAPSRRFFIGGAVSGTPIAVNVAGGDALADTGGSGGDVTVEADEGTVDWTGDIDASGGATADGAGAAGGDVEFTTYGSRRADIRYSGDITTAGSDGAIAGAGSAGGSVELRSLDGSVWLVGNVDASAGSAVGLGVSAGSPGGHVYLLVDDLSGDPNTDPDGVDLLDNFGRNVFFDGTITTAGGNGGGGGASNGSNAGNVVIDSDSDDGEQKTNGGGLIAENAVINAAGGNGSGTGVNGDGGSITLRASNRRLDNTTPSGCTIGTGTTFTVTAGTGGAVAGTDGTLTTD